MLRPTVRAPWLSFLAASVVFASPVLASAPSAEPEFRQHVESLVAEGLLGYEQGLLVRFQRVFAPHRLPSELDSPDGWPFKSATSLVLEYRDIRGALSARAVIELDGYLEVARSTSIRYHETEHFAIAYQLEGPHAVSASDVDPANGIPDFVERVGEYAEISWTRLIDEAGFTAPRGDKVSISFREMESFGYTRPEDGVAEIVLHRDFVGFPENRDPEGSLLGAVKVTVAHEFKHASQFAASGWSEGGWLEADATWAEDFVFDETDDYLRYLPYGSPITEPDRWLHNGQASYEDCLWQHLLAETMGVSTLVDFFARRSIAPAEPVATSFQSVIAAGGSSFEDVAGALGVWSYLSGANSHARPTGFSEAASYPTPRHTNHIFHTSETLSRELTGLGSHFVLVGGAERSGRPRVSFSASPEHRFAVHAITLDQQAARGVVAVPLAGSKASSHEIEIDWTDLALLAIVVTNLEGPGTSADYFLSVEDDHATGTPEPLGAAGFALAPNRPNPFQSSTSIPFSLAENRRVRLAIYDVAGRLVRRLLDDERFEAGDHQSVWDGTDEVGRLAAPGVYYYRLETNAHASTRKMLLLR